MAYPKNFLRLTWLFNMAAYGEIAETGLHVTTLGTSPFDAVAALAAVTTTQATTLETAMGTLLSGTNIKFGAYGTLNGLKIAACGTDGDYLTDPRVFTDYSVDGNDTHVPPQCSIVLSLRSGTAFGTANYGRMYLPWTTFPQDGTLPYGTVTDTDQLAVAGVAFIHAVNTAAAAWTAGSSVVNLSQKDAGTVKPVTKVMVGNVIDTQRRRRNKLPEVYSVGVV
jgi:hypothetical protein